MGFLATSNRILTCASLLALLGLTGCGGAESRKARHLEKGREFLAAQNFEKARVEFRNALQIAPNDGEARFENGVVDEKLGIPREAAQFYQGAIDVSPDDVRARAALGRLYVFSGAPDKALTVIKPGLVNHPDDAALLTVRAAARIQLKEPDGALVDAERAVQLDPQREDAVAVLAGIYKSQNQNEKAQKLLEDAVQRIPSTTELRLVLAQLDASLGQDAKAEGLLVDLVRLNPADSAHRLRLAQFYARLNHADEAERVLREGIKVAPTDRELKVALIDFLAARRSHEAAAKELAAMVAANPKDFDMRLAQAEFYEQEKDVARAEAVYREIIAAAELSAPGITARNRLAALKIQMNDVPAAEKLLAEVLAKSPRDNDALILRGNLALGRLDPKAAIADFRSVLRDQPNAVGVMRSLARAHLANGEPALAEETMRRAVDANPKDPVIRLDLAQLLAELGKPEQAKPIIDGVVKQSPDNVPALETQLKIAAATNDLVTAKAAADAIVATQPQSGLGYYYQGTVAEAGKKPEEAVKLYTKALELDPQRSEPLELLVRVLVQLKRMPDAIKLLDDVMARDQPLGAAEAQQIALAANLKGDLLLATQHPADAAALFKTAIDRNPKWWLPYRNLATAERAAHDDDSAIKALNLGISHATNPEPLETQLAAVYEGMGKPDAAAEVYESALRQNPTSDVAANNMAMLLVTYRKDPQSLDRAKALSTRFVRSGNPAFLDTYGWVLYKHGEATAAVAALQTAVSKNPESPVSLYHLGMAQASAGQGEAARENLTRSLKLGKNFSGMEEAKATLEKLATVGSTQAPAAPRS
jgi:tetratricopeptide (TPR) repeat protein